MKIWVMSDLHLEFGEPFEIEPPPGTDVVVCAGDILTKGIVPSLEWLGRKFAREVPVVFVAGNHEFYGGSILEDIPAAALVDEYPGLHFLENGKIEIDGVLFIGGTLWTDFRIFGQNPEVAMSYARAGVNDFKQIKFSKRPYRKFLPIDAYRKHQATKQYLTSELSKRATRATVVITHHAPSPRSLSAIFRFDPLSGCYASDLENLIVKTQPSLWVHGHVHHRNDYILGATRVVSNPRGYPGEASQFDPRFLVQIHSP